MLNQIVNGKKEKKRKLEESSVADTPAPSTPSTPAPAEKKQKKIKKVKDPNMPKRAMSAYMLWYQDASKEYKEKHPQYSKFVKRTTKFTAHDEQNTCGSDIKPLDGSACAGQTDPVWVCGTCGILYDTAYPTNVVATTTSASNLFLHWE